MTREESIEIIRELWRYEVTDKYTESEIRQALDMTIVIMCKYQKIVQIMERTVDDGTSMYDTLQEIEEVIEDGND